MKADVSLIQVLGVCAALALPAAAVAGDVAGKPAQGATPHSVPWNGEPGAGADEKKEGKDKKDKKDK
jgi:hypothetical protein